MVFFNYATMQMAAKIVYYGPGLCGKTTNLRYIYEKTAPQSRGEMVSLETETDRTLFFDLLPLDVGVIGGFKTRLQLYTVPGQVFYNTTRKLVLKGVDGIVFVADSQKAMIDADLDSFRNLRENLDEIGLDLAEIPLVIQLNKRDLPNVAPAADIVARLDPERQYEALEASAMTGTGVFETLKVVSKLTLRTLRKRMMGEEAPKPAAPAPKRTVFQVRDGAAARGAAAPMAPPAEAARPAAHAEASPGEVGVADPFPFDDAAPPPPPAPAEPHMDVADVGSDAFSATPVPPAASEAPAPDVKRLKVRSSIDIMAELEQLRKRATQTAAVRRREPAEGRSETERSVSLGLPDDAIERARRVRVTFAVEDADGNVVGQEQRTIEVDEGERLRRVTVDLAKNEE